MALYAYNLTINRFFIPVEKEEDGIAPQFTVPIKPKVAKRKKTTTLKCAVVGKPTPIVKWFRADEEIIPDERQELSFIPETNEHVLTIIETDNLDESIYTVQAVNKFGRAECRANIVLSKYS